MLVTALTHLTLTQAQDQHHQIAKILASPIGKQQTLTIALKLQMIIMEMIQPPTIMIAIMTLMALLTHIKLVYATLYHLYVITMTIAFKPLQLAMEMSSA